MARITVLVSNDLATDQRVIRVCHSLHAWGHEVLLRGRQLPGSPHLPGWPFRALRTRLLFNRGPLFYAELNLRFFFLMLFGRMDAIHANDLDTLLPAFLVARLRRKKLVYDTHEYFTGVPELVHRPFVRNTWKLIERTVFPRLSRIITVNGSIASLYQKEYGKPVQVMRNIPPAGKPIQSLSRKELDLPEDTFILILQGNGINVQRGAEEAVEMMRYLEGCLLLVAGSGDVLPQLKQHVNEHQLHSKVRFLDRMPYERLMEYTYAADLGLTLDKDTNINYRFSLPNKLFDYIHAGIPVLASNLVEVRKIVEEYGIGVIAPSHDPPVLARTVEEIRDHTAQHNHFKQQAQQAAQLLQWENEVAFLQGWYD